MEKILHNLANELAMYPEISDLTEVKNRIRSGTFDNLSTQLELAQRAERLLKMVKAGAYNTNHHFAFIDNLKKTKSPLWTDTPEITITDEDAKSIAQIFFKSNQQNSGKLNILKASHIGKKIIEEIIILFEQEGKPIDDIEFDEAHFHAELLEGTGDKGFRILEERRLEKWKAADKLIDLRQEIPSEINSIYSKSANDLLDKYTKVGSELRRSGELFYTLTIVPTKEDALLDNMDYDKYTEVYVESCLQPREEIEKAQAILVKKLDAAKSLRIWSQDGTDVEMSIDGMTFVNSVVLKNIPGSEVFSAPVKESVNGKIVSKGNYKFDNSPTIVDPWMVITSGKIIECNAAENGKAFQDIIFGIENANYFGEIGIGTNDALKRTFINGLLVEKVGGSFHMAVGGAYSYTDYNGIPVKIDNGNKSKIHWDITTLLRDMNSEMIVDGEVIQRDGKWLAPELRVLNEGWGALPEEKQPDWRKKKYSNGSKS